MQLEVTQSPPESSTCPNRSGRSEHSTAPIGRSTPSGPNDRSPAAFNLWISMSSGTDARWPGPLETIADQPRYCHGTRELDLDLSEVFEAADDEFGQPSFMSSPTGHGRIIPSVRGSRRVSCSTIDPALHHATLGPWHRQIRYWWGMGRVTQGASFPFSDPTCSGGENRISTWSSTIRCRATHPGAIPNESRISLAMTTSPLCPTTCSTVPSAALL